MGGRPTYGWLGEETGEDAGQDPTRRWIVDPLDGTTNFLHGIPHWSISIALEHKGEIVAGVIYDPAKDEMFWAEKGAGAWLNDNRRLRVSGRRQMAEAVVGGRRAAGHAADLCCDAAGHGAGDALGRGVPGAGIGRAGPGLCGGRRLEAYFERHINAWDMAAGLLLVREAGGMVSSLREGAAPFEARSVLAANEALFDPLAKLLRG